MSWTTSSRVSDQSVVGNAEARECDSGQGDYPSPQMWHDVIQVAGMLR